MKKIINDAMSDNAIQIVYVFLSATVILIVLSYSYFKSRFKEQDEEAERRFKEQDEEIEGIIEDIKKKSETTSKEIDSKVSELKDDVYSRLEITNKLIETSFTSIMKSLKESKDDGEILSEISSKLDKRIKSLDLSIEKINNTIDMSNYNEELKSIKELIMSNYINNQDNNENG